MGTRSAALRRCEVDLDHGSAAWLCPGAAKSHPWQMAGNQLWVCTGANPVSTGAVPAAGARAALSGVIWARGSVGRQEGMVVQPLPCVHIEPAATQLGKSSGSRWEVTGGSIEVPVQGRL